MQVRRIVDWVNSWSGVTLVPGAHSLFSDGEQTQAGKISQKKNTKMLQNVFQALCASLEVQSLCNPCGKCSPKLTVLRVDAE